jgi:signal peptidase I
MPPHLPPLRPRHPWRDTVEGILGALVLVLIIRHFVFEVFRIPTGSMAPTLLGQHRDLKCPNCGLEFPVDGSANSGLTSGSVAALCPNCKYAFSREEIHNALCTCFPPWPPSLFGRGDNRVIVGKFMWDYPDDGLARLFYRSGLPRAFAPPKRWDVIVFHCPVANVRDHGELKTGVRIDDGGQLPETSLRDVKILDQLTYIKRLVGLPGDTIRIRHGDIYVNGHLAVRPPEVQNAQWQFVYDSAYVPKEAVENVPAAWVATQGAAKLDGATLRLTPGASGRAEAQYGRFGITDVSTYSGYNREIPYYPVGEIKWDVEVMLDHAGLLRLNIDEDELHYAGTVQFGDAAEKTSLRVSGPGLIPKALEPQVSPFAAEPGKPHRVTFSNASGVLELAVDGAPVLSCEHPMPRNDESISSGVALGVESAKAEFSRVRLYRSIYYRPPDRASFTEDLQGNPVMGQESLIGPDGYRIPDGQYLALGDNQPNSSDGRYWGTVPQRNLIGRGVVLWWPVGMLKAIY